MIMQLNQHPQKQPKGWQGRRDTQGEVTVPGVRAPRWEEGDEVCRFACDGSSSTPGSFFPIIQPVFPFPGITPSLAKWPCSPPDACTLHAVLSSPLLSQLWHAKTDRPNSLNLSSRVSLMDECPPLLSWIEAGPSRGGPTPGPVMGCRQGAGAGVGPCCSSRVPGQQHPHTARGFPADPVHSQLQRSMLPHWPRTKRGSCRHAAPSKSTATGSLQLNVTLENTTHLTGEGQSYFLSRTCQRLAFPVTFPRPPQTKPKLHINIYWKWRRRLYYKPCAEWQFLHLL